MDEIRIAGAEAKRHYEFLLSTGLAREVARTVLPLGQYTCWHWRCNLRNIFGFLELRLDPHAQPQTRVYAQAMLEMLEPYFPNTFAAWRNHCLNAVTFSGDEWAILRKYITDSGVGYTDDEAMIDAVREIVGNAEDNGMRPTRLKEFEAKLQR